MILTFKIKHGRDFSEELEKAKQVAEFGLKTKSLSSADVKHIGLKSVIACQILRKYSRDKKLKKVRKVMLTLPCQSIHFDKEKREIYISCLKLRMNYHFRNDFEKINQIEINKEYAMVSVSINEPEVVEPKGFLGVDLNTTGHCVVVANSETGKIMKMGKSANHIHNKYKNIRKELQKKGKFNRLKKMTNREKNKVKDMNHKMSSKIVRIAKENEYGIRLENLKGIRKNKNVKTSKLFKNSLNSWSFYQFQQMIEYKAKLHGILVEYVDPRYTSQLCSRCGLIGNRNGKEFKCSNCGHVDHADVNASFNIALTYSCVNQSNAERDVLEGRTDAPKKSMLMDGNKLKTLKIRNPLLLVMGEHQMMFKFDKKNTNIIPEITG